MSKRQLVALADANAPAAGAQAQQASKKPNILVVFGDDIGQSNISAYTHGLMGYRTPNIDRTWDGRGALTATLTFARCAT